MAKNKKVSYIAKLTEVMDEGERRYSDKINHKDYAKTNMYGKGTNRINELHGDDCPRVNELAVILDMFESADLAGLSSENAKELIKAIRKLHFWGLLSSIKSNAFVKYVKQGGD